MDRDAVSRRGALLGAASVVPVLSGCASIRDGPPRVELASVFVENRSTDLHRVAVAIEREGELVYLDAVTASPAEWDGDDLVYEGGAEIDAPVDGPGRYAVSVRIDDGPLHTTPQDELASDGECISIRPNVERDGGFHFEYAYDSQQCASSDR